jgi:hypothetical protein
MALPKIELPLFEAKLPMTGEKVKYRPFTVREEKILLLAQESKEIEQAILAVKQVVNNCVYDVDIDKLSMIDLEYILLVLRSKSVDNNASFSIKDPETGESTRLELDLEDVKVKTYENHSDMIKISDEFIIKMRYPTINEFLALVRDGIDNKETNYNIMISCMDQLLSKDEVYKFKDFSKKEIDEFVDSLGGDVIKKIKHFFSTMPKLRHEIKYKNKNGNEKTFVIEGIETFFI